MLTRDKNRKAVIARANTTLLTLRLNIFTVLKVKFSVTYDVIFTVNVSCSEMSKLLFLFS